MLFRRRRLVGLILLLAIPVSWKIATVILDATVGDPQVFAPVTACAVVNSVTLDLTFAVSPGSSIGTVSTQESGSTVTVGVPLQGDLISAVASGATAHGTAYLKAPLGARIVQTPDGTTVTCVRG